MQSEFQGVHNQSFLFYSAFRSKTWVLGGMKFYALKVENEVFFHYFNNLIFLFNIFPVTAAKPYATAHISKSSLTTESILSILLHYYWRILLK